MATVLRHHNVAQHDPRNFPENARVDVPPRVYWAAAIGLVLLALLVVFSTTTASDPAASATYLNEQPVLRFTPFVPML